jgi:hypothetical protein
MIPQKQREKCTPLSFGVFFCPFSDKPAQGSLANGLAEAAFRITQRYMEENDPVSKRSGEGLYVPMGAHGPISSFWLPDWDS